MYHTVLHSWDLGKVSKKDNIYSYKFNLYDERDLSIGYWGYYINIEKIYYSMVSDNGELIDPKELFGSKCFQIGNPHIIDQDYFIAFDDRNELCEYIDNPQYILDVYIFLSNTGTSCIIRIMNRKTRRALKLKKIKNKLNV